MPKNAYLYPSGELQKFCGDLKNDHQATRFCLKTVRFRAKPFCLTREIRFLDGYTVMANRSKRVEKAKSRGAEKNEKTFKNARVRFG